MRRGLLALLCLGIGAAGCVLPNRYGTPRTLAEGETAHVLNLDAVGTDLTLGIGDISESTGEERHSHRSIEFIPVPLPSYTYRQGMWDRGELGLGIAPSLGFTADLKWNLFRSRWFDFAVAPTVGIQPFPLPDVYALGSLPVLLGINLGQRITFVPTGGVHWLQGLSERVDSIPLLTYGGSIQVRMSDSFAMQPGFVAMHEPGESWRIVHGGVALVFGDQPGYPTPAPLDRWR